MHTGTPSANGLKAVLCAIELKLFRNNGICCIFRIKQKDAEITPSRSRNHDRAVF